MKNRIQFITPCSRPENLEKIAESIRSLRCKYNWIVVFDSKEFPDWKLIPIDCFPITYVDKNSISGNAQRNLALDLISNSKDINLYDTYIYFQDDDSYPHKDLWENIKNLDNDFISFSQEWKDGILRLKGDKVMLNHIDSHNFLFKGSLLGNTR